jgi:HAD superfamily hydrolase (TIGR01549 family)
MTRAVLFDLFGTLIAYGDVAASTRHSWGEVLAVLHRMGMKRLSYEDFVAHWDPAVLQPLAPEDDVAETPYVGKILRLFRHYGLPEDGAAAGEAARRSLEGWGEYLRLPEDTVPTLQLLRRRFPLVLVSNFDHPPFVRRLLQDLGLAPLFDEILISGELRIDKPDPRIFQRALEAVRCSAEEAVFVGDSITADIAGADRVGCRPVLIDMCGVHPQFPGERIRRLCDLLPLLGIDVHTC